MHKEDQRKINDFNRKYCTPLQHGKFGTFKWQNNQNRRHLLTILEIWIDAQTHGYAGTNEVMFINGRRADLVFPTLRGGCVVEVRDSETYEQFLSKVPDYPELELIQIRAGHYKDGMVL